MSPLRNANESAIDLVRQIGCRRDAAAKSLSFFATRPVSTIDPRLLDQLQELGRSSGTNVRLCLHEDPQSALQEMVIFQHAAAFFPPKRHPLKPKSFSILRGVLAVFAFNPSGEVSAVSVLAASGQSICRVSQGVYHVDIPLSADAIHHEVTIGPFGGDADREMAPWGPPRSQPGQMARFRSELIHKAGLQDLADKR